jgi:putative peptidoglycan lipid II flippase
VGFAGVVVNVVLALGLMWPLAHAGLALASSLASFVSLCGLLWLLRRRLGRLGGREISRSVARVVVASLPLLAWCLWLRPVTVASWWGIAHIVGVIAGALVVYAAAAAALRSAELGALLGMMRRGGSLPSTPSG